MSVDSAEQVSRIAESNEYFEQLQGNASACIGWPLNVSLELTSSSIKNFFDKLYIESFVDLVDTVGIIVTRHS